MQNLAKKKKHFRFLLREENVGDKHKHIRFKRESNRWSRVYLHSNWLVFCCVSRFKSGNVCRKKNILLAQRCFCLGSYKYCCHGMFCPDCDLSLSLLVLHKSLLLNQSVSMTCQEISFRVDTEVNAHPGEYMIKVSSYQMCLFLRFYYYFYVKFIFFFATLLFFSFNC